MTIANKICSDYYETVNVINVQIKVNTLIHSCNDVVLVDLITIMPHYMLFVNWQPKLTITCH